jgi:PAS domain S-box-containing protein
MIEHATHLGKIATERERGRKALRDSEQRFRLMVEGVKDYAIFMLDPLGIVVSWNAGAERIKGYREEEIIGEHLSRFYLPEDIAQGKPEEALTLAADTGTFEQEGWRLRKDGSRFWADIVITAIRNEEGKLMGFSKLTRDLSDRKRAEEELREANERVEMVLDSITDNFFALSKDWRFTYLNKHAGEQMKVLGKDPARLIGKVLWEEFPYWPNEEALRHVMSERVTITDEFYYVPLGEWVENHMYPSHNGGLVTFQKYITERKRTEEQLRRSEAFLAEGQRISHTGSWAVKLPSEDVSWSQEVFRIYGLDPAKTKLSQQMALHLIHPEDRAFVQEAFERALRDKGDYSVEHRAILADGSIKHLHALAHPVLNESGDLIEYVGTVVDTTEQHQTRVALEQAFEEIKILKDRLYHENVALREEIDRTWMFEEIVGSSPAIRAVLSRVAKVAPQDSTVLIAGETGTGKELIARAIHRRSKRATRPFVAFNCAGIPSSLIASELFGHEKGAFTGAQQRRLGRFELAEGGTIFLDEIGELPTETQIALLRVIQEREFERVGGSHPIATNVRVIAASNRDLQDAIAAGTFRLDLFHRLNVFPIEAPPLRERKEDIPMLLEYFIKRYAAKAGKKIQGIEKKTLELFKSYHWPGNIRELQNVIERSIIVCESEIFSVDESWLSKVSLQPHRPSSNLSESLLEQEKKIIESALTETKGRIAGPSGAAARLGIPSSTLESKIRLLKIRKYSFKPV